MANRAAITEAATKRAIRAALAAGLQIKEVVLTVDGTRIVFEGDGEQSAPKHTPLLPKQWGSQ